MESQGKLQIQFPLDIKNKFWKKLIEKAIGSFVFAVCVTIFASFVTFLVSNVTFTAVNFPVAISLLVALFIIVFIGTLALYGVYVKAYIKRYYYEGEDHFITIKKGVFAPTEIHVQYQKIQDVYVDQDILDRIMGLYDVHIASATASSGIEAHIDGVNKQTADGLKNFLLNAMKHSGTASSGSGSSATMAASEAASVTTETQANAIGPQAIHLTEEISSEKYPLTSKWFMVSLITRIVTSAIAPTIILLFIFGKSKNNLNIESNYILFGWIALYIISLIWSIISLFLWRKNYEFKFNPEYLYYKTGVLTIEEKHMPYNTMQDVNLRQGVIYRMLGVADVYIENAAQQVITTKRRTSTVPNGILLAGLELTDAKKITEVLKSIVLTKNQNKTGL